MKSSNFTASLSQQKEPFQIQHYLCIYIFRITFTCLALTWSYQNAWFVHGTIVLGNKHFISLHSLYLNSSKQAMWRKKYMRKQRKPQPAHLYSYIYATISLCCRKEPSGKLLGKDNFLLSLLQSSLCFFKVK